MDTRQPQASQPPRLLDQVRNAIRSRHYSPRTEETYLHWIKRFIYFHGKRHPRDMAATRIPMRGYSNVYVTIRQARLDYSRNNSSLAPFSTLMRRRVRLPEAQRLS